MKEMYSEKLYALLSFGSLVFGVVLCVIFYIRLKKQLFPEKIFNDPSSKLSLVMVVLITITIIIISLGTLPGMLALLISFPIFFILGLPLDINHYEYGSFFLASFLYPPYILAAFFMSKHFSIYRKQSPKKLFFFFVIVFSLFIGMISAALPELLDIY